VAEAVSRGDRVPPNIVFRFVPGDDPIMREVADLCYETLHRPFGVVRNDQWDEMDPHSLHLVALDGDRLAGYARLIDEGRRAHIRQVSVAPPYRGMGIGTRLVRMLVEEARRKGMRSVYLNARGPALPMYRRLGFSVTRGPFRMGRTYLSHFEMERRLR
jgi:ribosomal protein S18 acetylase RimI-like enzyme